MTADCVCVRVGVSLYLTVCVSVCWQAVEKFIDETQT